MKKIKRIILILLLVTISICQYSALAKTPPPGIITSPADGDIIHDATPTIFINYSRSVLDRSTFRLFINEKEIQKENLVLTEHNATYTFKENQKAGVYKIQIQYDFPFEDSVTEVYIWTFTLDPPLDINQIIQTVIIGMIILFCIFIGYILYIKKTRNFTFQKYFIRHPIRNEVLFIYLPLFIAFLIGIFLVFYATMMPAEELDPFIYEYIFIIVSIIAITPYGIITQIDKKRLKRYEKAFSQFLFEVSDALRGGLDPAKAIIEISKNDTSILRKHLKRSADNIKLGRPFDEVMTALAKPIKSQLIKRYSTIIGETSKIGGDPATVIHRAAKDMDDFIKINDERRRQLGTQVTIIYIGFIVLAIVVYLLISMFPNLQGINIGGLMGNPFSTGSTTKTEVARMSFLVFKQRFFDLLLIDSICTGTIIGSFIEGNIKHGFIHSLVMIIATLLFFKILII